jgi:hypothetical protein
LRKCSLFSVYRDNCLLVARNGRFCNSSISLRNSHYRARARDGLSARNVGITPEGLNGQTALIVRVDGRAWSCLSIEVEQEQIQVIRIMINPDKLTRV